MIKTITAVCFGLFFAAMSIGNMTLSVNSLYSETLPCRTTGDIHHVGGTQMNILQCIKNNLLVNKSTAFFSKAPAVNGVKMYYTKCEYYDDRSDNIVYALPIKCTNKAWYSFNATLFLFCLFTVAIIFITFGIMSCYEAKQQEKLRKERVAAVSFSNPLYAPGETNYSAEPVYDEPVFASTKDLPDEHNYLDVLPSSREDNVVLTDASSTDESVTNEYEKC